MESANVQLPGATDRRDRVILLSSIVGVAALAWLITFNLGSGMDAMMPESFTLTLALWLVMMVAMMTPSVTPTLMTYATILSSRAQRPFARVTIFLVGYLIIWSLFSAAAALTQLTLHDLLSGTAWIGGSVLVAAGIFQFTPLKHACLARCRSPQGFFMTRWRDGASGALTMGLASGAYCLGCCWLLMGVLLATGAMNILWMALLAIYVLAEKLVRGGVWLSGAAGLVLVGAGAWMILAGI